MTSEQMKGDERDPRAIEIEKLQSEVEKLQSLFAGKEAKLAEAMDVLYGHKCLSGGNAYTDACYFCREIKKLEGK